MRGQHMMQSDTAQKSCSCTAANAADANLNDSMHGKEHHAEGNVAQQRAANPPIQARRAAQVKFHSVADRGRGRVRVLDAPRLHTDEARQDDCGGEAEHLIEHLRHFHGVRRNALSQASNATTHYTCASGVGGKRADDLASSTSCTAHMRRRRRLP